MARILFPGLAGPAATTPARATRSVRRTTTVDGQRPDGPLGDVVLLGRGRDLLTDDRGRPSIIGECEVRLRADFVVDQAVREISSVPPEPRLARLVGLPSRVGFRKAIRELLPDRRDDGTLLSLLLYEIPIVTSLSRLALLHNGEIDSTPGSQHPANRRRATLAVCAGWAPGGTMATRMGEGLRPMTTEGVAAPSLAADDDPAGWHELPALSPSGFRRRRRIDITTSGAGSLGGPDELNVESLFRDTYVAADGLEVIVHEYSVTARLDARSRTFLDCAAVADVLPAPECHRAAVSTERVVGQTVSELSNYVRAHMIDLGTCTHLNDHLHSLGDLSPLLDTLDRL